MASIRALLFDADGVIQHVTTGFEDRLRCALGVMPEPFDDFVRDMYLAEEPSLTGKADFLETLTNTTAPVFGGADHHRQG
jgi:hypothetical protein